VRLVLPARALAPSDPRISQNWRWFQVHEETSALLFTGLVRGLLAS